MTSAQVNRLTPVLSRVSLEGLEPYAGVVAIQRCTEVSHVQEYHYSLRRLSTVPGISLLTATALAVMVGSPWWFRSGRRFTSFGALSRQEGRGNEMKKARKSLLEKAGWKLGSAEEFLELTPEEAALVEMKPALSHGLREQRLKEKLTQNDLAKPTRSPSPRGRWSHAG
jgi:hypothetical protein